jgi:hypothetical protein
MARNGVEGPITRRRKMFKIVTSPGSVYCLGPFEGLIFASVQEAEAALMGKGYKSDDDDGEKLWEHPADHDFQWAEILPADPPPRQLWMVVRRLTPWYGGEDLIGVVWAATPEGALAALGMAAEGLDLGMAAEGLDVRAVDLKGLEALGMDVIIYS